MKERHQVIPRSLCFIKNNDSYLLMEYSEKKGPMAGYWNCPGWHIEFSEWIIENAEKEILEETWLKVENTKLQWVLHIEWFFGKNIMLFITLSKTHEWDTLSSDEWTLHWKKREELSWVNLMEDVKIILDKVETMNEQDIFTGKSVFDGGGKLLRIEFE